MPLLADEWITPLIVGVLGAVATLLTAYGLMRSRLIKAKASSGELITDAEIRRAKETATIERRNRKDALEEAYHLLQVRNDEYERVQEQLNDLRQTAQLQASQIAVCEFDRKQMRLELEDFRAAVEKAGIFVPRRPRPAGATGEVELHGPTGTRSIHDEGTDVE